MAIKRLQNKISDSRLSLLFTAIYAIIVVAPYALSNNNVWQNAILIALSTLLMVEFNNANALIRVFSRMVSCSFLMLSIMPFNTLYSLDNNIIQLCFVFFYLFFFRSYQNKRSMGYVYYAFVSLGFAGLFFAKIVFLVPILWILLFTNVLAGNIKTITASILGYITPYWLVGAFYIYRGQTHVIHNFVNELTTFNDLFDYSCLDIKNIVAIAFIALLCVIGTVHFLRNSFLDKIRTRMIYEALMIVNIVLFVVLALQPQYYDIIIKLIIVNTAPFIGHFIALTKTRLTNITFVLMTLIAVCLTFYSIWTL